MKIVFFGSSDFSIPALQACLDSPHEVVLVVTTPDKKKGRGLKLSPTVVKEFALEKGLEVISPASLKDEAGLKQVRDLAPELFVVSSYGKLIPNSWLETPTVLSLNVHPSLLPKYRGASPINRPIVNGDAETGVSIMEVIDKLDAGDIFAQETFPLTERLTADQLSEKLSARSYYMVQSVLEDVVNNRLKRIPQNDDDANYAEKLTKEESWASLRETADVLDRKIRGFLPWPGTMISVSGDPLILLDATPLTDATDAEPGTIVAIHKDGSVDVATGEGVLKLLQVKPSGKKAMKASDFIHGKRFKAGAVLTP